jgi:hypothetical protein
LTANTVSITASEASSHPMTPTPTSLQRAPAAR